MSRDLHLAQLVADGRVSPDGLIARRVALEVEQERAQLLQRRLDARNARRRARRAAGKGTRPAGSTAPAVQAPVVSALPLDDGLVECGLCRERVTPQQAAEHRHGTPAGVVRWMTDADFAADPARQGYSRPEDIMRMRW